MAVRAQVTMVGHGHVRQAVLDGRHLSVALLAQVLRALGVPHVCALHARADHVPCMPARRRVNGRHLTGDCTMPGMVRPALPAGIQTQQARTRTCTVLRPQYSTHEGGDASCLK